MIYLVIFFTSLVLTIFFTPILIDFFTRIRIVDFPGEDRRINNVTVPRMGGLIIYIIVLLSIISFFGDLTSIRFFLVASGIIALLGMIDDMIGVKWNHKFVIQFLMSFFLVYFFSQNFDVVYFFGFELAYPFNFILLILFVVGVINSVNLLDGLDGLASGFSLLIIFVTFLVGVNSGNKLLLIISSSLMGTLIGFLKFNAFPARIYLGDTGAYILGFFLVTAAIIASTNTTASTLDLTFPVILLGLPIIDTVKVMLGRIREGRNPFIADLSHLHHIILKKAPNHKLSVFFIESIALLFAALSLYYLQGDKEIAIIIFGLFSVPLLFVKFFLKLFKKPVYPEVFKTAYHKFPQILINVYIKFLIPVIAFLSLTLLIVLTPVRSQTNNVIIIISLMFILLLFIYSLLNYQKNKYLNDILVFFNLLLFLIYSNYSEQIYNLISSASFEIQPVNLIIFMLLPSVVFFLFFREKILEKKVPLLSGIDLIILVFIILLSVSSNFLHVKQFSNANLVLFHGFLVYIFYKVFIILRAKYKPVLFFLSFAVPVAVLVHLLLSK